MNEELKKQLREYKLIPLYKEAIKYNSAENFVNAIWERLNIKKNDFPIREYNLKIAKMINELDKYGYANFGWFDGFTKFYNFIELKGGLKKC